MYSIRTTGTTGRSCVFLTTLTCAGLESAAHDSLPGGFGKYAGLCMLSGNCCAEALPTTRGGSRR